MRSARGRAAVPTGPVLRTGGRASAGANDRYFFNSTPLPPLVTDAVRSPSFFEVLFPCWRILLAAGGLAGIWMGMTVAPAPGQTLFSRPYATNQIAVEVIAPSPVARETDPLAGAAFVSGTYAVAPWLHVAGELPVAASTVTGTPGAAALGNPYVGIGLSGVTAPILVEAGVRLPVASPGSVLYSAVGSDPGRTRAFRADEVAVSLLVSSRLRVGRASTLRLRAGAVYGAAPPNDTTSQRTDENARLRYGLQYWNEGDAIILGLSVAGRTHLTGSLPEGGMHRHHVVATVLSRGHSVQPGLLLGVAVEDIADPDPVIGLTVSVPYGR